MDNIQQPKNTHFTPGWSAFSQDWFTKRIPQWEKFIVPLLANKPCRWLELGSYEGRSAIWTLDNIITHPDSQIVCVDIWNGKYEDNFDKNIAAHPNGNKVIKIRGDCFNVLKQLNGEFDGVYIDADHQAKSALTDAAMVWPLLKNGGFMIFDDYPWQLKADDPNKNIKLPPKPGIDAFLTCWIHEYKLIHKDWQVIIQKH